MLQPACTDRPHRKEPRQIQKNQKIHDSVYVLMKNPDYKPAARFPDGTQWDVGALKKSDWTEKDPHTEIGEIVRQFISGERTDIKSDADTLQRLCNTRGSIALARDIQKTLTYAKIFSCRHTQRGVYIACRRTQRGNFGRLDFATFLPGEEKGRA